MWVFDWNWFNNNWINVLSLQWFKNVSSMLIVSGAMGVDTFFLLSAMLMTLSVFRELDKTFVVCQFSWISLWLLSLLQSENKHPIALSKAIFKDFSAICGRYFIYSFLFILRVKWTTMGVNKAFNNWILWGLLVECTFVCTKLC